MTTAPNNTASPAVLAILQKFGVKADDLPKCAQELTAAMNPPAKSLNSEARSRLSKFYEGRANQFQSVGVTKEKFLNGYAIAAKRGVTIQEYAKGA